MKPWMWLLLGAGVIYVITRPKSAAAAPVIGTSYTAVPVQVGCKNGTEVTHSGLITENPCADRGGVDPSFSPYNGGKYKVVCDDGSVASSDAALNADELCASHGGIYSTSEPL